MGTMEEDEDADPDYQKAVEDAKKAAERKKKSEE